jgi:type I restriction enzyme S subunit
MFPKGTITMTIAANVGDVAILGFDAYFPDSVVGFTVKDGYLENYIYYLFCSMKEMFIRTAVVSTQLNLNLDRIKELLVPVTTDIREQQKIADYLDKKCAEMDTLIAKKTKFLAELENYKKSLIYEYVTGKREVEM